MPEVVPTARTQLITNLAKCLAKVLPIEQSKAKRNGEYLNCGIEDDESGGIKSRMQARDPWITNKEQDCHNGGLRRDPQNHNDAQWTAKPVDQYLPPEDPSLIARQLDRFTFDSQEPQS